MKLQHSDYIKLALKEAQKTQYSSDIPVGCLIVSDGTVIGRGHNIREKNHTALGHAEIIAIDMANKVKGNWRLNDCTLYVTLEPCIMCTGAIINARIPTVVFGSYNIQSGCCCSLMDINQIGFPHKIELYSGICEMQCNEILKGFFDKMRNKE